MYIFHMEDISMEKNGMCEVPFVSATILDNALTVSGRRKPAIQKYRQTLRKMLAPPLRISLGRKGSVFLDSIATMSCLAVAGRWGLDEARKLALKYKKAGFSRVAHTRDYKNALELLGEAVRANVHQGSDMGDYVTWVIARCWAKLAAEDDGVRKLAVSLRDMFANIAEEEQHEGVRRMNRVPGRLVRFEGRSALISLETTEEDADNLRLVPGDYLRAMGTGRNGDAFVLHEYRWSPDTTMSMYFPAVDFDYNPAELAALMARMKAREKPLPQPPLSLQIAALLQPLQDAAETKTQPVAKKRAALVGAG